MQQMKTEGKEKIEKSKLKKEKRKLSFYTQHCHNNNIMKRACFAYTRTVKCSLIQSFIYFFLLLASFLSSTLSLTLKVQE